MAWPRHQQSAMHPPRHPEEEDAFYAHQPEYLDANLNADSAYAQYDVPEAQYYSSYYPEAQEMDMVEDQTQYDAFGESNPEDVSSCKLTATENEILQQPVVDRRMQAAEGRARLTLPRATSGVAQRSPIHSLQETQRINGDIGKHLPF